MSSDQKKRNLIKESRPKMSVKTKYTYADYLCWSDDNRYELIDGVVYMMTPAPGRHHQKISAALLYQFYNYLIDKKCEVYHAPFDVRLAQNDETEEEIYTVVQPDLSVVCDFDKLDDQGCKGAPDLIIEIISPGSGGRDRKIKRELYEKHGVKEYWIVDYYVKTVDVYLLNDKKEYGKPEIYTEKDKLPVNILSDLEMDLKLIFI